LKRQHQSVLPDFKIVRGSRASLHRQIYDTLRNAILSDALPPGSKLPSTRTLATTLQVSRNTVLLAYETLSMEGLLVGKTGSGTRVRRAHPQLPPAKLPALRTILREAHYPNAAAAFCDPDGNPIYAHR